MLVRLTKDYWQFKAGAVVWLADTEAASLVARGDAVAVPAEVRQAVITSPSRRGL